MVSSTEIAFLVPWTFNAWYFLSLIAAIFCTGEFSKSGISPTIRDYVETKVFFKLEEGECK